MSDKELDSLFRNKLEQLARKPSASAWEKIQAGTSGKKTAPILWLRVAAAIVLLITSGLVIWQVTKSNVNNPNPALTRANGNEQPSATQGLAQTPPEKPQPAKANTEDKQKIVSATPQPVTTDHNETLAQHKVPKQSPPAKKEVSDQEKQTPSVIEKPNVKESVVALALPDATIEKQSASDQKKADQGRTLEFNLSDFETAAFASNEAPPTNKGNAMKEESKGTQGLNKVIGLMKELKTEANIRELREVKNELFAFNFKKENKDDSK